MKVNKKFDIDLKYGQVREKQVSNIFANKKIEIKTGVRDEGNLEIVSGLSQGDKMRKKPLL